MPSQLSSHIRLTSLGGMSLAARRVTLWVRLAERPRSKVEHRRRWPPHVAFVFDECGATADDDFDQQLFFLFGGVGAVPGAASSGAGEGAPSLGPGGSESGAAVRPDARNVRPALDGEELLQLRSQLRVARHDPLKVGAAQLQQMGVREREHVRRARRLGDQRALAKVRAVRQLNEGQLEARIGHARQLQAAALDKVHCVAQLPLHDDVNSRGGMNTGSSERTISTVHASVTSRKMETARMSGSCFSRETASSSEPERSE
eukprot:6176177-Prymnesium_polylepis.1